MQNLEYSVKQLSSKGAPTVAPVRAAMRGVTMGLQDPSHGFDNELNNAIETILKEYNLDGNSLNEAQKSVIIAKLMNSSVPSAKAMTTKGIKTYLDNYLEIRLPF